MFTFEHVAALSVLFLVAWSGFACSRALGRKWVPVSDSAHDKTAEDAKHPGDGALRAVICSSPGFSREARDQVVAHLDGKCAFCREKAAKLGWWWSALTPARTLHQMLASARPNLQITLKLEEPLDAVARLVISRGVQRLTINYSGERVFEVSELHGEDGGFETQSGPLTMADAFERALERLGPEVESLVAKT